MHPLSSLARRALAPAAALAALALLPASASAANPDTWTRWLANPSFIKIRSLDFTTPATLFGGSDGDGVFGAGTALGPWSQKNTGLDPQHGDFQINQVYAGGGTIYAATSGGLFRGTDPSGGSWNVVGQTSGEPLQLFNAINSVYVTGSRIVVAAVSSGFYYSDDQGAHWNKASGTPASETPFYITAAGPALVAASSSGVFVSFDQGSSWQLRSDGLPFGTTLRVAVDPTDPTKIYALVSGGVYKTSASNLLQGAIWSDANGSGPIADSTHNGQLSQARSLLLAPSTFGTTRYFAGTASGVFATVDNGATWGKLSSTSTVNENGVLPFGQQEVQSLGVGFSPPSLMAGTSAAGIYSLPMTPIATSGSNAGAIVKPDATINAGEVLKVPAQFPATGFTGTLPFFFTYKWKRCTGVSGGNGTGCTDTGEKGEEYAVTASDVGKYMVVDVTARNIVNPNAVTQSSPATTQVAASPADAPVLKNLNSSNHPGLTPTASSAYGVTYTATPGTWARGSDPSAGISVSASYLWERCTQANVCTKIPGTTTSTTTYTSTPDDINDYLSVTVTVTNATYGTSTATPSTTMSIYGKAATLVDAPRVIGDPYIGEKLSSTVGTWKGQSPTYARQWKRCESDGTGCNSIIGATDSEYTLTEQDRGKRVLISIESDDQDQFTHRYATAESAPTDVIGDKPVPPAPSPSPSPSAPSPSPSPSPVPGGTTTLALSLPRTLRLGSALGAPKTVTGFAKLRYQWLRNGKPIKHATRRTYRLTREDRGKKIRCRVTLIAANGQKTVRYTKTVKVPRRLRR